MSYGLGYSQKRWGWRAVGIATFRCLVNVTGIVTDCEAADMHDTLHYKMCQLFVCVTQPLITTLVFPMCSSVSIHT